MRKLLRFFFYRPLYQRLPMLPRMYSSDYELAEVDRKIQTLMQLTQTRCPQGVELLLRRYRAASTEELIRTLRPRRHKRRIFRRFIAIIQRLFGLMPYDPMRSFAREDRQRRQGERSWRP